MIALENIITLEKPTLIINHYHQEINKIILFRVNVLDFNTHTLLLLTVFQND